MGSNVEYMLLLLTVPLYIQIYYSDCKCKRAVNIFFNIIYPHRILKCYNTQKYLKERNMLTSNEVITQPFMNLSMADHFAHVNLNAYLNYYYYY